MLPIQNSGALYKVSSSLLPTVADAQLAGSSETVGCPQWLYSSTISDKSLVALATHAQTASRAESNLVTMFQTLLRKNPLNLITPPNTNNPQALYEAVVKLHGNLITLAARLTPITPTEFDLRSLEMRENATGRIVGIKLPGGILNTSDQLLYPSSPLTTSNQSHLLTTQQRTAVASPVASSPTAGAAASSISSSRSENSTGKIVSNIVKRLLTWEQSEARTLINDKLASSERAHHVILLQQLLNQLSTKTSGQKLDCVKHWSAIASLITATEGRDTRSAATRERQQALSSAMRIPIFKQSFENIAEMLSNYKERKAVSRINDARRSDNYGSVLFRRVFSDSRGPIKAITAIEEHIKKMDEVDRFNAIVAWQPLLIRT